MFRSFDPDGSTSRTGDVYSWTGHGNGATAYVSNGLNQQISIGGSAASWDSKGNLASDPASGKSYTYYPSDNALWTASSPFAAMSYDPLGRLAIIDSSTDAKFAYDGLDALAEYDGGNALQRRYVFGPGMDEPLVQYEGSGTTDRRFMGSDERGSIISLTDSSGALIAINRYDEYGKPQSTNAGRFQYTGQKWLGEAGLYDYKARAYLPHLGIFGQTDPAGYADSPNLYAYVLNDPVNLADDTGERPYQIYPSAKAAVNAIRSDYFGISYKRGIEYGGRIFAIPLGNGRTGFFYDFATIGQRGSIDPFPLYYSDARYLGSRLVWEWHTHIVDPSVWRLLSENDKGRSNLIGINVVVLWPGGQTVYRSGEDPNAKASWRAPKEPGSFVYTYSNYLSDHARELFGPLNTIGLVAYLIKCVHGEVDLCQDVGPGTIIHADPREVPGE